MNTETALKVLERCKPKLQEQYGVTRIGVFGSVARNEAGADSDVDIVIEMERPNLFLAAHIKEELEALLQRPVDLVRLRQRMNPALKRRIEQEAIYV
ncbi:MAG: nucleotidyltransferase family protein [Chloracidobacterium sp.]|nr:nucleotidyltransferase family protein [Chloracidobacterium sp.]MDW8217972.1 nucleotidyltransferase family protein [Acidobacteriota bacterium]